MARLVSVPGLAPWANMIRAVGAFEKVAALGRRELPLLRQSRSHGFEFGFMREKEFH